MPNKLFNRQNMNLAVVSFLCLYLELLLIRLIGTEIRVFAYVSNLILLTVFVATGIGMLIKRKLPVFLSFYALLVVLFILLGHVFDAMSPLLSLASDSLIWYRSSASYAWITYMGFFVGILMALTVLLFVAAVFIPLGNYLGSLFNADKNVVRTYSINVLFSLLGIWTFNVLSSWYVSPYLALVIAIGVLILLIEPYPLRHVLPVSILVILILLGQAVFIKNTYWSPYQKLQLRKFESASENSPKGYDLLVNNVGYMTLFDWSAKYTDSLKTSLLQTNPAIAEDSVNFGVQYNLPYYIKPYPENVLIIGSGGGNDAAGALRAGAKHIDAVEIDPAIAKLGKQYHPENPYASDRVNLVINDGRAFMKTSQKKYDVIIFALADSHTLNSPITNFQLDNYLYTYQSFITAKNLLKDDGVILVFFAVDKDWTGERIKDSLSYAFGHEPLVFDNNPYSLFGWAGVTFATNKKGDLHTLLSTTNPRLASFIKNASVPYVSRPPMLSDNWPYLYLKAPKIPVVHIFISFLLITLLLLFNKKMNLHKKFDLVSFSLGAAFMLYEFQNIGKTSVIYGNTWQTNVFTISAILILVLLANLLYTVKKLPASVLYTLVFLSFILQLTLSVDYLSSFSGIIKYVFVPLILNLPLLFSGMLFIGYFDKASEKDSFMANNLFGSAVGGLVSFVSYILGIKFVLFASLGFYIVSMFRLIYPKPLT